MCLDKGRQSNNKLPSGATSVYQRRTCERKHIIYIAPSTNTANRMLGNPSMVDSHLQLLYMSVCITILYITFVVKSSRVSMLLDFLSSVIGNNVYII